MREILKTSYSNKDRKVQYLPQFFLDISRQLEENKSAKWKHYIRSQNFEDRLTGEFQFKWNILIGSSQLGLPRQC